MFNWYFTYFIIKFQFKNIFIVKNRYPLNLSSRTGYQPVKYGYFKHESVVPIMVEEDNASDDHWMTHQNIYYIINN